MVSGAGAAGVAVTRMLIAGGVDAANIVVCDSRGRPARRPRRPAPRRRRQLAAITNAARASAAGSRDALAGADVLIGVSGGQIAEAAVAAWRPAAIVFALANPTPEVHPTSPPGTPRWSRPAAATSPTRSTTCWPSPGIFRGALDAGATRITEGMKLAAADAIAAVVADEPRPPTPIVPSALDPGAGRRAVAAAVGRAAAAPTARWACGGRPCEPAERTGADPAVGVAGCSVRHACCFASRSTLTTRWPAWRSGTGRSRRPPDATG